MNAVVSTPEGKANPNSPARHASGEKSALAEVRIDNHLDDVSMAGAHNLPNVEELKAALGFRKGGTPVYKKKWFQVTAASMLLILVIGLIVGLSVPKHHGVRAGSSNSRSPYATESRMEATVSFLSNFVSQEELTDPNSPQFKAARWMADDDVRQVPLLQGQFLQRFALVVFWYATEGHQWRHGINFLSADHECDWHMTFQRKDKSTFEMGVRCDQTQQEVTGLILRKFILTLNSQVSIFQLS